MKEKDLRPCDLCGQPLRTTHDGKLSPFEAGARVVVQRMMIDTNAVNQRVGLMTMFGGAPGAAAVAGALGAPLDTLEPPELRDEIVLCCACWLDFVAPLVERCSKEEPK